jgi:hypothetical protein
MLPIRIRIGKDTHHFTGSGPALYLLEMNILNIPYRDGSGSNLFRSTVGIYFNELL